MRSFIKKSNNAARYLRLSREDGDKLESDSISNQRDLINEFGNRNSGINIVEEYVDDGYSGTNYDRPAFNRMLEDIKSGKIDCIIVKDLSRLGRNYIETGRYLEKIFPFMGVRFISVIDNYDSASEDGDVDQIIVPFKNLINDSYCRDISMKIRSQLDVKRKKGKFIGSFASYGYLKDKNNKNHLVLDPFAADIVKQIFRLKLEGYNSQRIAETLSSIGVLPPAEYKRSQGMNYDSGFCAGTNTKWSLVAVNRILTNEIYTGTMVQGINRKINYKVKQSRVIPKEEWIRVEDTHDAIIERPVFEEVQRLLEIDTRTSPDEDAVYIFSGLVVCGDCGQNMVRRRTKRGNKIYNYFHCSTYKGGNGCSSHLINAEKLEQIVLETIQKQIALVMDAQTVLNQIEKIPEEQNSVKVITGQIAVLDGDIERYRNLKTKVYTDMLDEVITKEEFADINARFSTRLDDAKSHKNELLQKKHRMMANTTHLKPWVDDLKKYQNIAKLERQVVVMLIDQIVVYGKDSVHIRFHYGDEMQEILEMAGMMNANDRRGEDATCVL
ncbi:MAG: recombinase family protein [Lachnospiraceae bacterium]|nr:recombinase family protein [Lachnospiraceae bacterium]